MAGDEGENCVRSSRGDEAHSVFREEIRASSPRSPPSRTESNNFPICVHPRASAVNKRSAKLFQPIPPGYAPQCSVVPAAAASHSRKLLVINHGRARWCRIVRGEHTRLACRWRRPADHSCQPFSFRIVPRGYDETMFSARGLKPHAGRVCFPFQLARSG